MLPKKMLLPCLLLSLSSALPLTANAGFFDRQEPAFGSASATGFLPVEQAFQLEGRLKGTTLTLHWQVEPEHYLYRSRFNVRVIEPQGAALREISIPRGEQIRDEFQGDVEILRDKVQLDYRIDLPAEQLKQGAVVEVTFQGCAEAGLCYPPHSQRLNLVPQHP